MATLYFEELVELVQTRSTDEKAPNQISPLQGVMYIKFGYRPVSQVNHSVMPAADRRTIVIDKDPSTGDVVGIEIVG